MTVDIPIRTPEQQGPGDQRRTRRGLKGGSPTTPGRSRTAGRAPLVVGGQPRANLLPPEIVLKRAQLKTRRALRGGVLLVAIATAAACAATFGVASVAQVRFAAAQQTQQQLVLEQAQFGEVTGVLSTIDTITAARRVGSSTEIAWQSYLTQLQDTLPSGVTLVSVDIQSGTPMSAFGQSDAPLRGERVASLNFTATSSALPSIPDWLRSLETLPGFVDATPGSVKQVGSAYTADVLMHINTAAFSMRFDPEHMAAAQSTADATSEPESESETVSGDQAIDGEGN